MATMPVVGASHVPTGRRGGGPVLFRTWHRGTRNGRSQWVRSYPNLRQREKPLPPLALRIYLDYTLGRRPGAGKVVGSALFNGALIAVAGLLRRRDRLPR